MRQPERRQAGTSSRSKLGVGFELLAVASGTSVAVVLTRDARATAANIAAAWLAVFASVVPLVLSVMRTREPLRVDALMSLLVLSAIGGSYTIGGIALAIPAFFLLMGGALHHTATRDRERPRRILRRAMFGLGVLLFLGGLVSVGAGIYLAPVGAVLLLASQRRVSASRDEW